MGRSDKICTSRVWENRVLTRSEVFRVVKRQSSITCVFLQGFEKIKVAIVEGEPFTPENNLLTPTLKMKRNNILVSSQSLCPAW